MPNCSAIHANFQESSFKYVDLRAHKKLGPKAEKWLVAIFIKINKGPPPTLGDNVAGIKEKNSCIKAAFSYAGIALRSAG
jgi:hypothetical protein